MFEKIIFLFQAIGIPIIVLGILHLPFWMIVKKKKVITKLDYIYPLVPILSWVLLSSVFEALNVAPKSIANIFFELLVIVIVSLLGYIIRTFIPISKGKEDKSMINLYIIIISFVFLFSLFMPLLPE